MDPNRQPPTQQNPMLHQPLSQIPSSGSKWKLILSIIILLIFVGFGVYYLGANQNKFLAKNQQAKVTSAVIQSPTPTSVPSKPIDPNAWVISIPKGETVSTSPLTENDLVYALKSGYASTVYKRNLQNGTQTKIFEFNEPYKADKSSGNMWEGLPPNMALSPDREQIAFIDQDGLKLYNLQSGTTKVFIYKTTNPTKSIRNLPAAPQWSVSLLNNEKNPIYDLGSPLWSSDGKYITFLEANYEGSSCGAVETESGAYIALNGVVAQGYGSLSWSPLGHTYATGSDGPPIFGNLYISSPNNIAEANNIAAKLVKNEFTKFPNVSFSPDGQKIVFIFEEADRKTLYPVGINSIATASSDGTGFTLLDNGGGYIDSFFSSDGNSVFVIQKRGNKQVLVEINLVTKKPVDYAVLPSGFDIRQKATWTKDDYLVLVANYNADGKRLMILNLQNKKVVYTSSVNDQFTTFAGFSN